MKRFLASLALFAFLGTTAFAQFISPVPLSSGVPRVICASSVASPTTGDTTENTLATCTVPAASMGANGIVRITTVFSYTNSANAKSLRVKFGGTTYQNTSVTTTASVRYQAQIANVNATNSQKGSNTAGNMGTASSGSPVTSAVDTTAAVTILITGQNSNSGETITLESYLVELIPYP